MRLLEITLHYIELNKLDDFDEDLLLSMIEDKTVGICINDYDLKCTIEDALEKICDERTRSHIADANESRSGPKYPSRGKYFAREVKAKLYGALYSTMNHALYLSFDAKVVFGNTHFQVSPSDDMFDCDGYIKVTSHDDKGPIYVEDIDGLPKPSPLTGILDIKNVVDKYCKGSFSLRP